MEPLELLIIDGAVGDLSEYSQKGYYAIETELPGKFNITHCRRFEDYSDKLTRQRYDFILVGKLLPQDKSSVSTGYEVARYIRNFKEFRKNKSSIILGVDYGWDENNGEYLGINAFVSLCDDPEKNGKALVEKIKECLAISSTATQTLSPIVR